MLAEAVAWRRALRIGERGRATVVQCLPGCDVLGTAQAPGCWFDFAVGRLYELERALGL